MVRVEGVPPPNEQPAPVMWIVTTLEPPEAEDTAQALNPAPSVTVGFATDTKPGANVTTMVSPEPSNAAEVNPMVQEVPVADAAYVEPAKVTFAAVPVIVTSAPL